MQGEIFFHHSPLTFLALLAIVVTAWFLHRTPAGLTLCMPGENPMSAEPQGLSVFTIRTVAVMAGSALMAIGGAFLTMSAFDAFYIGMVNGRGWICIALVVFASWRPGKALLGALLFVAGVNVAFGHDCVMDPWYPMGSHDMLKMAHMGAHYLQMMGAVQMAPLYSMITSRGTER